MQWWPIDVGRWLCVSITKMMRENEKSEKIKDLNNSLGHKQFGLNLFTEGKSQSKPS